MTFAFDRFTVDPLRLELRCDGQPVRVQRVPLELLVLLIERAGTLVDRSAIELRVWGSGVHVDAEHGINTAIRKLRRVLADDPEHPRFIQTVVGQGYRFVAPVRRALDSAELTVGEAVGPAVGSVGRPATADRTHRRGWGRRLSLASAWLVPGAVALAVAFAGLARRPPLESAHRTPHIAKVTVPGNELLYGVISPDGRQLAYLSHKTKAESLWVRGLDAPGAGRCLVGVSSYVWGVTYSPAADFLYYVVADERGETGSLFRVAVLGGRPERLLSGINGAVQFDPSGQRMAFKRAAGRRLELVTARPDGSDVRTVATSAAARPFQSYAWSPDGRELILVHGDDEPKGLAWAIMRRDAATGREQRVVTIRVPSLNAVQPLPDGGFLGIATDPRSGLKQVWRFSPNGEQTAVTLDTHDYAMLSVARDGRTALATKWETQDSLWVSGAGGRNAGGARIRQVLPGGSSYDTPAWGPAGGILFALATSLGRSELWWMSADGAKQRRLRPADAANTEPAASPDGRFVVFTSDGGGAHRIWRVDLDDDAATPLTAGPMDGHPRVSASGDWVTYASHTDGGWSTWIVPAAGGPAKKLADSTHEGGALSPDESRLAHTIQAPGQEPRLVIRRLPAGDLLADFPLPSDAGRLQWTADGKGVTYLHWGAKSAELWLQPLRGPSRRLERLGPDEIQQIDRDPASRQTLLLQRHLRAEFVLITW